MYRVLKWTSILICDIEVFTFQMYLYLVKVFGQGIRLGDNCAGFAHTTGNEIEESIQIQKYHLGKS